MPLFTSRRLVAAGLAGAGATVVLALPALAAAQPPFDSGSAGMDGQGPVLVSPDGQDPILVSPDGQGPGVMGPDERGPVIVSPDGRGPVIVTPGEPGPDVALPVPPGARPGPPVQCERIPGDGGPERPRILFHRDGPGGPGGTLKFRCERP
ncbi:hypothetical protein BJY24_004206 [Nocardia transvalensis]|uniref:Uncharacterized protein n=1 Tax=Nocardia transvalensis TaxID=37333 RepID=A0A7W9PFL9_9NOCA|nr:hypothetical protein [Nocardia transvalensis]